MQMRASLHMNSDDVGSSLGEALDLSLGRIDHQVNIEGKGGVGTNRLDHPVADSYFRDKLSVHDIDMDVVGACFGSRDNLLAQMGKVDREDRRCQLYLC